jgi:WD40 repeat protein
MEIATCRLDQEVKDNFSPRNGEETSSLAMATTVGHTARIWGLRFLRHSQEGSLILSFGEDATSQIWQLRAQSDGMDLGKLTKTCVAHLQHECAFEYHAKKNIWSAAVHTEADGSYIVSTGGADGRIVCFDLNAHNLRIGESRAAEWTMNSVLEKLSYDIRAPDSEDIMAAKTQARISPENVFTALRGRW